MAQGIPPTELLREYADAIRGDWGSIDGRSVQGAIHDLVDHIENGDLLDPVRWRDAADLCKAGGGHWQEFCLDLGCEDA